MKLYIYPHTEDANYAKYILTSLIKYGYIKAQYSGIIDDAIENTGIDSIKDKQNSIVLISAFDNSLFKKLLIKAKDFNSVEFSLFISHHLNRIFNAIDASKELSPDILNIALYFISYFKNSSNEYKNIISRVEKNIKTLNKHYKSIIKDIDIIYHKTSFADSKHLGNIDEYLLQSGLKIAYFVDENDPLKDTFNADLVAPFLHILNANLSKFFITSNTVCNSLKSSHQKIIVPHAFIYPIAALAQRDRELNRSFFEKMSRNKNSIICASTKSNYEILKSAFGKRVLKAGYPSFDLLKDQNLQINSNKILLAINDIKLLHGLESQVKELLNDFLFVFRPNPAQLKNKNILDFIKNFKDEKNFFFDDNTDVLNKLTHDSYCCFSDSSSISYTFAIAFKRAVILVPNKKLHIYKNINFFDKRLHILYNGNMRECISKVKQFDISHIENYIKDEIYNYKKSSEFVAKFIKDNI